MVAAILYAKHFGVSAKLTIYIVMICVVVEQMRTHEKILPVRYMLMTFELLFHVDSGISLTISTRMPYSPILASEGLMIGRFYL